MKKNNVITLSIIVIAIITLILCFSLGTKNELKDQTQINTIVEDSNLELLLNLGNITSNSYDEAKLLEVSMQLASEKGFMNESLDGEYFEYVNQADLHEIIKELTNINIEAPIQVENFYYVYDSENEYYYFVPTIINSYKISKIDKVYNNENIYTIESTATITIDGEIGEEKKITTKLKHLANNEKIKYQVIEQTVN